MNNFATIEGVIDAWVEATGSTLFTEWAGEAARYFHVPGTPPFECFQVNIGAPSADRVRVLARSIDTNDDSEWEQTWQGPVGELDAMLSAAMATIKTWKERAWAARG